MKITHAAQEADDRPFVTPTYTFWQSHILGYHTICFCSTRLLEPCFFIFAPTEQVFVAIDLFLFWCFEASLFYSYDLSFRCHVACVMR